MSLQATPTPVNAMAASMPSSPNPPAREDRFLTLIERRSALGMFAIATLALTLVWISESMMGVIEPHDRWALPVLAALMGTLFVVLLRRPASLIVAQRLGTVGVSVYFLVSAAAVLLLGDRPVSPYWITTMFQWLPPIYLLLFATWPARWALALALGLFCGVVTPAVYASQLQATAEWRNAMWPVLVNGAIAQAMFLLGLLSLGRLRRGLTNIVFRSTVPPASTQDATEAIEAWVAQRTAELARAKDAAEAASQAKSRFLAVMSHELRTPLHAVLASAELLRDTHSAPQDADGRAREEALIDIISASGRHLLTLIDQVLELSRIEAGKLELADGPLDLSEVAHQAVRAVQPQAEAKHLTLGCDIDPRLHLQRRGDALRLAQVLINLMANAVKFTERGSVSLSLQGGRGVHDVRFVVRDTGPGLTPEQQARVFDAFHQVDAQSTRQHGGAGLGLTITRELVQLMRGDVQLSSRRGLGTEVTIRVPLPLRQGAPVAPPQPLQPAQASMPADVTLPLRAGGSAPAARVDAPAAVPTPLPARTAPHTAPPPPARPAPPAADALAGVRVLVVEDDPVNSMLAIEMLRSAGADVETVESGPAALALLRSQPMDVVLMDWRMPGMDGLEATRRIRAGEAGPIARRVPVIGLTANAFAEDRQACLDAGMDHVLTKPIERNRMLHDIRQWAASARTTAPTAG
jgi:signal transduction histidine kinase/ActR/RegA family two-component response regulator